MNERKLRDVTGQEGTTEEEIALSRQTVHIARVGLDDLLQRLPARPKAIFTFSGNGNYEAVGDLVHAIKRARNFAWALQRFPRFDETAFQMAAEQWVNVEASVRGIRERKGVRLIVPRFAVAEFWSEAGALFRPCSSTQWDHGFNQVNALGENRLRLASAFSPEAYYESASIYAEKPAVPETIRAALDPLRERFDRILLCWEAQWRTAPVADPLVLGEVMGRLFLLTEYDTTRAELYVRSEMTVGPEDLR